MASMLNRFELVGTIQEIRIDLFKTHIRCCASILCFDTIITVYYSVYNRYGRDKYDAFMNEISTYHGEINGNVFVNGEKYYSMEKNEKASCVYVCGNVAERNETLFFNARCFRHSNVADMFNITIEGVPVGSNNILNICDDRPRLFHIDNNVNPSNNGYIYNMRYNPAYYRDGDIVVPNNATSRLSIMGAKKSNVWLDDNDISNYLLEYKIVNE